MTSPGTTRVLTTLVRPHASVALVERLAQIGATGVRLIAKGYSASEYRELHDALVAAGRAITSGFRVVVDLPGGKPRIGGELVDLRVRRGMLLLLHSDREQPVRDHRRPVPTVGLMPFVTDLQVGDRILVADGTIETKVVSLSRLGVTVEVQSESELLAASRSINLPDSGVRYPSRGDDDGVLLEFERDAEIEVAVSMTASADDVRRVHALLPNARVSAKVESVAGLANLAAIAEAADELIVARADMSIEVPLADLGCATQQIVAAASEAGKPCMVASGFLDHLERHPRPSIAELADLWHLHRAGIRAFMLSGTVSVASPLEVTRWACALLSSFDDQSTAGRRARGGAGFGE